MVKKIVSMEEAAAIVKDGDMIALGGNVLHRAPMAFVRELVRQGRKQLRVVKTAGAHDVDILCAGECVQSVDAGFISYETEFGLAMHYRKSVESGQVKGNEHACYTVICALRAAAAGAPFMPVRGLKEGDLISHNDYFKVLDDPFGSGPITVVKALVPDVAVIHVQECDQKGNARIFGPKYDDVLISRAARKVIITAEQIVPESKIKMHPESVDIPHFMVSAVVHVPGGAAPCSCDKKYNADTKILKAFKAMKTRDEIISNYIKGYEQKDRNRGKVGGML